MHPVRRPLGERRDRRPVARSRPDAAPGRRPAADQQRRRRVELRDARAGQADPHLRRGVGRAGATAGRRSSSGGATGRAARDPRPRRPRADPDTLLIADRRARSASPASWVGRREVGDATPDVVVESAIFDPVSIRRTAQRFALRSEASLPVREGPGGPPRPARRRPDSPAARGVGGRHRRAGSRRHGPDEPDRARVAFRPDRVDRLLGTELPGRRAARAPRPGRRRDGAAPARDAGRRRAPPRSARASPR